MSTLHSKLILCLSMAIWLCSCTNQKEILPEEVIFQPKHFPPIPQNTINPSTPKGVALGNLLFFDPILSKDSSISCASCHHPEKAFSDAGNALSSGINNLKGFRNSPSLTNLAWKPLFFHDGGANSLELQAIAPIEDHVEMGNTLANVLFKLNNNESYKAKFKDAFGRDKIETRELIFVLAQFQRTIVSANSKYDQYVLGKTTLSSLELEGLKVFENNCSSCHKPPLFTDFSFVNNGLDDNFPSLDFDSDNVKLGRARVTKAPDDLGKFMVPSLRNIMVTHPYMHDGRLKTIDEVLTHYETGIKKSPSLHPSLVEGIVLEENERTALKAFLETLTDYKLVTDQKFASKK